MSKEPHTRPGENFKPQELLSSADFYKHEGNDVSETLKVFEGKILEALYSGTGAFEATITHDLLAEVGAEIFDTLLSDYLKWYKCKLIAVKFPVEGDHLAFEGYAQIEKPFHLGLGIAYQMENDGWMDIGTARQLRKLRPVAGSVHVAVDANLSVRAAVAAMKIDSVIAHMLGDPAGIVRKTLECRLRHAYGCREPLGEVGLSIEDGLVGVEIYAA